MTSDPPTEFSLHRIQPVTCRLAPDGPAMFAPLNRIQSIEDAGQLAIWYYRREQLPHERVVAFLLNGGGRVLGLQRVSDGGIVAVGLSISSIMRTAIVAGAVTIVLAHNHPSGNSTPSAKDLKATTDVTTAAGTLGIELYDHLVVAFDRGVWSYTSVKQHALDIARKAVDRITKEEEKSK